MAGEDNSNGDVQMEGVADMKKRCLTDPGILSMMSNKLNSLVGTPSHYIASLPTEVKQRIKALKKLQIDYFKANGEFYKEAAELENKYFTKYYEIFNKRNAIVEGKYEPKADECEYTEPNEEVAADLAKESTSDASVSGIPSFWLTCMKNAVDGINDYITEEDEPILEQLREIEIQDNVNSFKLLFHFNENEYFSDTTLTKEFKLKLAPTEDDPFNFDGPEIVAMKGMKINWKSDDKNVTVKTITKKQRNTKTGSSRTITKTISTDSFFNFFNHPEWIEDGPEMSEAHTEAFQTDTNLGSFFRERLVPRAVLYFTGESIGFGEDYDEEVDEDCFEDEEADPDFKPSKKALRAANQQKECKQQ